MKKTGQVKTQLDFTYSKRKEAEIEMSIRTVRVPRKSYLNMTRNIKEGFIRGWHSLNLEGSLKVLKDGSLSGRNNINKGLTAGK